MAFPTIPTVGAGRVLVLNQLNTTSTRTFPNLDSLTFDAGDLLVAIIVAYQTSTGTNAAFSSWGGGFTEFHDSATSTTLAMGAAYKFADGTETGTFSVTQAGTITGDASMILLSIPGAHASTPPEAGSRASGTTSAADPAAFDPSGWASEDTLWIAVGGSGCTNISGSWTGTASAPTNYSNYVDTNPSDTSVIGDCDAAVAFRQLAASSENVGGFTTDTSNARNGAFVIAVRPAPEPPNEGSASGSIDWAGSATGSTLRSGAASGSIAWAGSADGVAPADVAEGSASGSIAWVGSATGAAAYVGAASGAVAWAGTVTGSTVHAGAAAGSIAWAGAAAGAAVHNGAASGSISWAGSATGEAPAEGVREGAASGAIAWVGVATGSAVHTGVASGALAWVGAATGVATHHGAGLGSVAWSGTAVGGTPGLPVDVTFEISPLAARWSAATLDVRCSARALGTRTRARALKDRWRGQPLEDRWSATDLEN